MRVDDPRNLIIKNIKFSVCIHISIGDIFPVDSCKFINKFIFIKFVTSRAKTFLTVSRFKTYSHSPAVHLPFEWTGMPFERLDLSVLKKVNHAFERFGLSVQENSSAVWTAQAVHSKKIISRSNGSSYPFEKFISHSNGSSYPFEKFAAVPTRQDFKTIRHALLKLMTHAVMFTLHKQSSRFCSLFIFV